MISCLPLLGINTCLHFKYLPLCNSLWLTPLLLRDILVNLRRTYYSPLLTIFLLDKQVVLNFKKGTYKHLYSYKQNLCECKMLNAMSLLSQDFWLMFVSDPYSRSVMPKAKPIFRPLMSLIKVKRWQNKEILKLGAIFAPKPVVVQQYFKLLWNLWFSSTEF